MASEWQGCLLKLSLSSTAANLEAEGGGHCTDGSHIEKTGFLSSSALNVATVRCNEGRCFPPTPNPCRSGRECLHFSKFSLAHLFLLCCSQVFKVFELQVNSECSRTMRCCQSSFGPPGLDSGQTCGLQLDFTSSPLVLLVQPAACWPSVSLE